MSELIDRQEVLKVIREMSYIGLMEKEAVLDAVKGLTAIEIMGCKDCRYNVSNGGRCNHCDDTRFFVDEKHRPLCCQYGKQKEN